MTQVFVIALLLLCGWLGVKLSVAHKDIADLRGQVASLKRQLSRMR